jgi:fused signal recognition particle receptor
MLKLLRDRGGEKTRQAVEKTRRTWFGQITSILRRTDIDSNLWDELEELLIGADVGLDTTELLIERARGRVLSEGVWQPGDILDVLKGEMATLLSIDGSDDALEAADGPIALLVVGVNGAGKTTSIAKLARLYMDDGQRVVLGAADTFRAAAIEQLQSWGNRLGVEVIAHQSGADPGAVAFDALEAARARQADVVIIDTAGRLHTKSNLMEELGKIQRVLSKRGNAAQRVLLTLDATTGQNGLFQARSFTEALSCDGVFLSKLDGTAKGGVVVAIADELGLPVLYIGTGEQPDDIAPFDPKEFVEAMFDSGPSG